MFEFELKDAKNLINILNAFNPSLDELSIQVDKEGVILQNLDPGHFRYFHLDLKKSFFDKYVFDYENASTLNSLIGRLDIGALCSILNIKTDTSLGMIFDEEKNIVIVKTGCKFQYTYILKECFSTNDLQDLPTLPTIPYSVFIEMDYDDFKETILKAKTDKHVLTFSNGELSVTGKNYHSKFEYKAIPPMRIVSFEGCEDPISSTFARHHTTEFLGWLELENTKVQIGLKNDSPLELKFSFEHPSIHLTYLQAPRID